MAYVDFHLVYGVEKYNYLMNNNNKNGIRHLSLYDVES